MLCAQQAALALLRRHALAPAALGAVELHDAFAAQGLAFAAALGLPWQALNAEGSGLARGHPIGASGAIALVRALARRAAVVAATQPQALALACVALSSKPLSEFEATGEPVIASPGHSGHPARLHP